MGLGRVQRRPEIDALRGVFLVWMTLAHLPTHLSDLVNEPFGFVSSAEGFVFLSALLVARLYIRQAAEAGAVLRTKLWKRALRIYGSGCRRIDQAGAGAARRRDSKDRRGGARAAGG